VKSAGRSLNPRAVLLDPPAESVWNNNYEGGLNSFRPGEADMAELKTQKNDGDVEAFIDSVDEKRREDCRTLVAIMREITGDEPSMWGTSIIGFGSSHLQYSSGQVEDWFQVGFSPRKQNFSLYIMADFPERTDLLKKLGKHKTGKSCLYINKLADIDLDVLKELIHKTVEDEGGC
jgi:hypothetical protein